MAKQTVGLSSWACLGARIAPAKAWGRAVSLVLLMSSLWLPCEKQQNDAKAICSRRVMDTIVRKQVSELLDPNNNPNSGTTVDETDCLERTDAIGRSCHCNERSNDAYPCDGRALHAMRCCGGAFAGQRRRERTIDFWWCQAEVRTGSKMASRSCNGRYRGGE